MKVSVIISTSVKRDLGPCLKSLEKQTYEDFEIILISNTEIKTELENYDVNYFVSNKKNLSVQRNLGIKKSEGDVVAFIDDDAVAHENWLKNLVKHYDDREVMCVGGKVIPQFKNEIPDEVKDLDEHILFGLVGATFIKWEEAGEIRSPLIWGCNISFRKKVFEEVGYFPENLGRSEGNLMGGEETFLQIKIMDKNYKVIYEPDSVVDHYIDEHQLTENYLVKRSFWQGFSEIERLRIAGNFGYLNNFKEEIEKVIPIKFMQKGYSIYGLNDLKEKIDIARSMGRLFGLRKISKGFEDG
ncbi:MAG: glycosyltransferase family 2 protein [Candidatus Aenigmatarchaeota archaeon]